MTLQFAKYLMFISALANCITSVRLSILDLKLLINSRFIRFWLAQGYAY